MTRAFFFDIDGTLVPWDSMELPSRPVMEDLEALHRQGNRLFLCTGRPLCDVGKLREFGFDGIISGAGARIQIGEDVIYHRTIPRELLAQTVQMLIQQKLSGLLEGTNGFYYAGEGKRKMPWDFPRIYSCSDLTGEESIELFTIRFDDDSQVKAAMPFLKANFEIYRCDDPLRLEMGLPGQNKAQAMARVCTALSIPMESTVAFGDSENDLAMLEAAQISVAMDNAPECVKKKATLVTGTVAADGICQALRQLKLLP